MLFCVSIMIVTISPNEDIGMVEYPFLKELKNQAVNNKAWKLTGFL